MSITVKTSRPSRHLCGFCQSGHHHHCPGGVLNGNLTEVVTCPCDCATPKLRCLNCNAREDVNADTWQCNDVESCEATRAKRRAETLRNLYGASENGEPLRAVPLKEKPAKAPAKPKTGTCLCCGETTGGGLFRPGHDARYLSRFVTRIKEDANPEGALRAALAAWESQGISEALRAKLAKRVA